MKKQLLLISLFALTNIFVTATTEEVVAINEEEVSSNNVGIDDSVTLDQPTDVVETEVVNKEEEELALANMEMPKDLAVFSAFDYTKQVGGEEVAVVTSNDPAGGLSAAAKPVEVVVTKENLAEAVQGLRSKFDSYIQILEEKVAAFSEATSSVANEVLAA